MAQLRDVSNGAYALDLLQKQVGKLVQLQAPVAAGEGTEPLHQMRVAMRRLSTTLVQFEPALQVPAALNNQRLAKWVRRLGMARDLDVLRERLEDG
ncbi:CHAD domain-containing protein, partial [Cyanobium sp. BA20m-14]